MAAIRLLQKRFLHQTVREVLASSATKNVQIHGWVTSVRAQKTVAFVHVTDGSTTKGLQVVASLKDAENLTTGASIACTGTLTTSSGRGQSVELQASKIDLLGECSAELYPLQKKAHSLEFLREISHLRARSRTISSALRIRHEASWAVHQYFKTHSFTQVNTPILTSIDCEGAGEMFRIQPVTTGHMKKENEQPEEFFGVPTFLTVSGQLQAEILASAFARVYTLGPTFRAENSQTPRHLAEFWMLEAEIAFLDSLSDLTHLTSDLFRHVVAHVLSGCADDLDVLDKEQSPSAIDGKDKLRTRLEAVASSTGSFPSITYTDAINTLNASGESWKYPVQWGLALQMEHERYLAENVFRGSPVFVTDYPRDIKPFYMRLNDTASHIPGATVAAMDFLVPRIGELAGGSLREERLPELQSQIQRCGLDSNMYDWYLDLRRYGTVRHGGFGMGFERLILFLTGMQNVRDVIPFPRHVGQCTF